MDDMISRQAAIEAINKALDRQTLLNRFVRKVAIDAIKQLPSGQLTPDIDEVMCGNCKYSERFVDGLILCRRTKTSHRVSATSTCGKGKREVEDAEAKI